jgi:rhamnosyltransferase
MDVSIIIRTKNEEEALGHTLTAVIKQKFSGRWELIVVDSGSIDSTVSIARSFGARVIHIPANRFTYGKSLNCGAGEATGSFIVNLSAHACPRDENWLVNLIDCFREDDVAGVYGRQLSDPEKNPFEARQSQLFFGQSRAKYRMVNGRNPKGIHFSNSNCAIRRKVWERYEFDERVPYAEDIVWQTQVVEAGYSIVYAPEAAVYHTHKLSSTGAYRNSKRCAYALAGLAGKGQSVSMVAYDFGIFAVLVPKRIFEYCRYVLQNDYRKHLGIAPVYATLECFGWLLGRMKYRLGY